MQLFSGSCGSFTPIACGDVGGMGAPDDVLASGLTVGDTYFFRVYDYRTQFAFEQPGYDLCVVEGLGSGLSVDDVAAVEGRPWFGPNPSSGELLVGTEVFNGTVVLSLMDAQGRVVHEARLAASRNPLQVTLPQDMPNGLYLLRASDGTKQRTGSVVTRVSARIAVPEQPRHQPGLFAIRPATRNKSPTLPCLSPALSRAT